MKAKIKNKEGILPNQLSLIFATMWCPSCSKSIKGGNNDSLHQHLMSKPTCINDTVLGMAVWDEEAVRQLQEALDWELQGGNADMGGSAPSNPADEIADLKDQCRRHERSIHELKATVTAQKQQIEMQAERIKTLEEYVNTLRHNVQSMREGKRQKTG